MDTNKPGAVKPATKSLIINHEWTRMDTNVHDESTEYTEETEASQTSAMVLKWLSAEGEFESGRLWQAAVCSAVRHASRK